MSGMNSDQLYRSTMGIYSSLMDDFNPSLQKLVSLGNSYVQAFQDLAVTSEAYFSALSKIGERAFHTISSRSLGEVLIQISESQRRLTVELDGVFRWFTMEVLQEMDNNIRQDRTYISDSRKHYEMEVHNQAVSMDRQLRRGANQDCSEYVQFLRESHSEALKEEERRYRFLSEKHCGLIQSIAHLMNKTGGSLQQRADTWTEEVGATRGPEARRPTSVENLMSMKEDMRKSREELPLGKIPSRAPSPVGSVSRSAGGRSTRARVAHQPSGSNPTLLPFSRGETISVLVQQPRNGWLYGRTDSSSRQGWFPASYVEQVDDPPTAPSSGHSSLRSSNSMSNLLDQSGGSSYSGAPPPPPPPPSSSNKQYEMRPITPTPDKRAESNSEKKRSKPHASQPELFPRGTNPFATIKLKPTSTDDRSAPRVHRR
ncbi:brain-specific angiogenesis inhibitor 1-associated protein 2-like protein 2 isoform X1 [Trematomus bernacchii]|uniref:brain-specific angiogenesis inhibitor 1-associated protein 2-like protein 2 isoform X1 n=1 Tax=Trematomus bernacchii TaxID=40690 RepID=UPI001469BC4A|nr:brain-specific angiogenesis inhibitor 1-associated protein 2-like protein 2 isoform X1 [Trematomus bernacchii]